MSKQVTRWELDEVRGAVVVVDVLRAFTTAAYAFEAGAKEIYLVASVDDALVFKNQYADVLAMGEDHGRRPAGFDFSNSPVAISKADLTGRTIVQRTTAGTQGVLAAKKAGRLWAASLVCATATAKAVTAAGLGSPTYVITGRTEDQDELKGHDDRLTADLIDRVRLGQRRRALTTAAALHQTYEAQRLQELATEHSDLLDTDFAANVDLFDFAMEATHDDRGVRLRHCPMHD